MECFAATNINENELWYFVATNVVMLVVLSSCGIYNGW